MHKPRSTEMLQSPLADVSEDDHVNRVRAPLVAICQRCANRFDVVRYRFACSSCGSSNLLIRGVNLNIDQILVEVEPCAIST